jgi:hypothetical protein
MIYSAKCPNMKCNHWQVINSQDIRNYIFKCNFCGTKKGVVGRNGANFEVKCFENNSFRAVDFCQMENAKEVKPTNGFIDAKEMT